MSDDYLPNAKDFEDEKFALMNTAFFDKYIKLRLEGVGSYRAFRQTFGDDLIDGFTTSRIYALERNPYFTKHFKQRFDVMKPADMWSPKVSVFELLQIVKDDMNKATSRISAIRELNVLLGITVIDDLGKSKVSRSLEDFYKENGDAIQDAVAGGDQGEIPAPNPTHTTH
jgi:hypothetical protein